MIFLYGFELLWSLAGLAVLGASLVANAAALHLPMLGWFSIFIIRTSLKSCWNTEKCFMTSAMMNVNPSSVIHLCWESKLRKCYLTLIMELSDGKLSHNKLLRVCTCVAGLHFTETWDDLRIVGQLHCVTQYEWCSDNVALNPALHC